MNYRQLFHQTAKSFVRLLEQIDDGQWDQPGLGSWSVRSLAGHTTRAILTVESYLSQDEPGDVSIPSADTYYAAVLDTLTDHASIAQRGEEAGAWLSSDPVDKVRDALKRTVALVNDQPEDRAISIGGMGILLNEYLRTRIVELVVHSVDLARATGLEFSGPPEATSATVELLTGAALHQGHGERLLLALTGRAPLPEGFTLV